MYAKTFYVKIRADISKHKDKKQPHCKNKLTENRQHKSEFCSADAKSHNTNRNTCGMDRTSQSRN